MAILILRYYKLNRLYKMNNMTHYIYLLVDADIDDVLYMLKNYLFLSE